MDEGKVVRPGRFERPATGVEIRRSIRAELQALMNWYGGDGQIRTDVCLTQADLQSAPLARLDTPPENHWQAREESNFQPPVLETDALPG